MGSFWNRFGIILGSFLDRFGIVLGSFWDYVGTILGSFCGNATFDVIQKQWEVENDADGV